MRDAPAAVDRPDLRARLEPHVVEEDLVEVRLARDLAQRPHRDAARRPSARRTSSGPCAWARPGWCARAAGRRPRTARSSSRPSGPTAATSRPSCCSARVCTPGEVGAGGRLGEELAPDLLGGQHRPEVALLLLLGAVRDQRRAEHPDADDVEDAGHPGAADLLVDDHLLERAEAGAAVLRRPGDGGEAALGQAPLPCAPGRDVLVVVTAARRRLALRARRARRGPWRGTRRARACRSGPQAAVSD